MKKLVMLLTLLFVASEATAALTLTRQRVENAGSEIKMEYTIGFDSSYDTGGEGLTASQVGLTLINRVNITSRAGYVFEYDYTTAKVKAYYGGVGAYTPAGTVTAPSVTVVSLSGTGLTAAGQVVTTTESFTATLNQYAGGLLLPVGNPPQVITSHAAVNNAPLVLTVRGEATTNAGTFDVLNISAPAFTGSATTGAVAAEVVNGTNLSSLTGVTVEIYGK